MIFLKKIKYIFLILFFLFPFSSLFASSSIDTWIEVNNDEDCSDINIVDNGSSIKISATKVSGSACKIVLVSPDTYIFQNPSELLIDWSVESSGSFFKNFTAGYYIDQSSIFDDFRVHTSDFSRENYSSDIYDSSDNYMKLSFTFPESATATIYSYKVDDIPVLEPYIESEPDPEPVYVYANYLTSTSIFILIITSVITFSSLVLIFSFIAKAFLMAFKFIFTSAGTKFYNFLSPPDRSL